MSVSHDQYRRWLHQSFTEGLPRDAHERLREHLRGCEACARLHARYARLEGALYGDPGLADAPAGMVDRLGTHVHPVPEPPRWSARAVVLPSVVVVLAAAFAGAAIIMPAETAREALQARGGGPAQADVTVRLLRLSPRPDGPPVVEEVGPEGRIGAKDRLAVLYSNRGRHAELRVRLVHSAGLEKVVFEGPAAPEAADTPAAAPIARPEDWPAGSMSVVVELFGDGPPTVVRRQVRW